MGGVGGFGGGGGGRGATRFFSSSPPSSSSPSSSPEPSESDSESSNEPYVCPSAGVGVRATSPREAKTPPPPVLGGLGVADGGVGVGVGVDGVDGGAFEAPEQKENQDKTRGDGEGNREKGRGELTHQEDERGRRPFVLAKCCCAAMDAIGGLAGVDGAGD